MHEDPPGRRFVASLATANFTVVLCFAVHKNYILPPNALTGLTIRRPINLMNVLDAPSIRGSLVDLLAFKLS